MDNHISDIHPSNSGGGMNEHLPTAEESIDFMRYLQLFIIHKWIFLLALVLVVVAAAIFALRQPVYYEAEYEVFHNESAQEIIVESNLPVLKTKFDRTFWLSVMKSDELIKIMHEEIGMYDEAIIKRMVLVEDESKKDEKSNVFKVKFKSKRNDLIPILARSFVKSLNQLLMQYQIENTQNMIAYLGDQIGENQQKLQNIDRDILSENGVNSYVNKDLDKLYSDLQSFKLDLLNCEIDLADVRAAKIKTQQELSEIDGTIVNESAFSEPLKVQLMNLQVDLARALTINQEDHPTVLAIRENIVQISQMLRDSIEQKLEIKSLSENPLKSSLTGKLIDFKIREVSLESRIMGLQSIIAQLEIQAKPDSINDNLQRLRNNREYILSTIQFLTAKLIETQSETKGSLSRFLIIDQPKVPQSPSTKSLQFILLLGLLGGLAFGVGAVVLYDFFDNRIMLPGDFEKFYPQLPVIGSYQQKTKPEMIEIEKRKYNPTIQMTELAEAAVNIRRKISLGKKKIFAIISPIRREGKSFISYQLAQSLAYKNQSVLLVDMDFINPKTTLLTDAGDKPGILDYINNDATLDDIVQSTEFPNLFIIGKGKHNIVKHYYYDDPKLVEFTKAIGKKFDVVLLDTPGLLFIPHAFSLIDLTDGLILITRMTVTTRAALDRLLKNLGKSKVKVVGVILNGLKGLKLGNYYPSYYSSGYGNIPKKNKRFWLF